MVGMAGRSGLADFAGRRVDLAHVDRAGGRNLQIERQNDQGAFPTTWIHRSDSALRNQAVTQNAIGTVAMYWVLQRVTAL